MARPRDLSRFLAELGDDAQELVLLYAHALRAGCARAVLDPLARAIPPARERGEAAAPDPALSARLHAACEPRERAVWADVLARRVSAGDGEGVRAVERLAFYRLGEGAAAG
ncbi:MAG: hypothetical protein ACFBWO_07730 [Paracoccaceae bacterium]